MIMIKNTYQTVTQEDKQAVEVVMKYFIEVEEVL